MKSPNYDVVRSLTYHPKERLDLFHSLFPEDRADVFFKLSASVQQSILDRLSLDDIVLLFDQFDPQQAKHLLIKIQSPRKRAKIVSRLTGETKEQAEYFLRFHPDARFELMDLNYLLLSADMTIAQAAESIEIYIKETGKTPLVLVSEKGSVLGEVVISSLIKERNNSKIRKFVQDVSTISFKAHVQDIVQTLQMSRHNKVVVIDKNKSVLGVVHADDALDVLGDTPAESLYDFAGVQDSEKPFDGILQKVKNRYKGLVINLGTAFLASLVVSMFSETLDQIVLLAVYMPIVAGMGGNAASQALAVTVRGIAMGEVSLKQARPVIAREIGAGMINGLITGVLVSILIWIINKDPMLGLVVALAMIANLIAAGFFGTLIPLVMKKLGKDPATSATIFITTATDVLGFFVFLQLATNILL
jgi:magnesium transporter